MGGQSNNIDPTSEREFSQWLTKLRCSRDDLLRAIRVAGTDAAKVRAYLQRERFRSALGQVTSGELQPDGE